jgi:SAM-dependent MidA family methyltransferase
MAFGPSSAERNPGYRRPVHTWSDAMARALYAPDGFYRQTSPEAHFRTSVTASPLFARTLVPLVAAVDEALHRPARFDLVDVGAGDGRLLAGLLAALPHDLAARTNATAVELRPRPSDLPTNISWTDELPDGVVGLMIANEYLDNVPCDVIVVDDDGRPRPVMVDLVTGDESPGSDTPAEHLSWLERWWPIREPGARAEVGVDRDQAWADIVRSLQQGTAVAVDYGHLRGEREAGAYAAGTLTGFRDGYQVVPVPDRSCDLTAHVAIDACASEGLSAGAEASALLRQGDLLRSLGLDVRRPPVSLAHTAPHTYVEGLSRASQAAELIDPTSLGSFWWLLQTKRFRPALEGIRWDQVKE